MKPGRRKVCLLCELQLRSELLTMPRFNSSQCSLPSQLVLSQVRMLKRGADTVGSQSRKEDRDGRGMDRSFINLPHSHQQSPGGRRLDGGQPGKLTLSHTLLAPRRPRLTLCTPCLAAELTLVHCFRQIQKAGYSTGQWVPLFQPEDVTLVVKSRRRLWGDRK